MADPTPLFNQRKNLDEITTVPDSLISVYVVEKHIWDDPGVEQKRIAARAGRQPNAQTVSEFLIQPVRAFLTDIFRQMAAPYNPAQKDLPIGQGYWIQAEFGSGKSHLLSFVGALALGDPAIWKIVQQKEQQAGLGRRESLYAFYEGGLQKKAAESKGILVVVKTLVGEGGGAVGSAQHSVALTEYILDAIADQYYCETGHSLPLYPTQILAERFLKTDDFNRYYKDLAKYLKDPKFFDEEEQQEIEEFKAALNNPDPHMQRDVGERLWDFYTRYLKLKPEIPMETEAVLEHMVTRLLEAGYAGLLLVLDEISLFMKGRSEAQRIEDEKTLVVLSNRLAKVKNLPVWLVVAAQEKIETGMGGVKNILARERLDPVPLLADPRAYSDIALSRVRTVTDKGAIGPYYEAYKRSFSWPPAFGKDEFARFFPFYPPSIDVVRALSYNLTTVRSALYFMLETLKSQRKRKSNELITLWALFEEVVNYEEDPSGTSRAVASLKSKWPDKWRAYETARAQLDAQVKGSLKLYRNRADKIIKTLFLYHLAERATNGLSAEELMNAVMEWKDHDKGQTSDLQDNLDHYTVLADAIALEIAQVEKVGASYRFRAISGYTPPSDLFNKARAAVEHDENEQTAAWETLLAFDGWTVRTQMLTLNLGQDIRSALRAIAPGKQTDITVQWHKRFITGRVYMRDLRLIAHTNQQLPSINSDDTGLDFAVFISSTAALHEIDPLLALKYDPRVIFWSPDTPSASERALLLDYGAYRRLVAEYSGRDTEEARAVLEWVQNRLRDAMGTIYKIIPAAYGRGRLAAANHAQLDAGMAGELAAFLTPVVAKVLDGVYASAELEFTAPAPFDDANAINVINGIVKVGEIEYGSKINKDISAAKNYGFDLRIMRKPNDRKLDLSGCRYTQEMLEWVEQKLHHAGAGHAGAGMAVTALYKNFMGVGGPGGVHYGLSRRMVQLYLLALVRTGKLRVTLSAKSGLEAIDYTNMAGIDFKSAVLDAMDQVQLLTAPEGWELLAPYAAALLDDPAISRLTTDAEIQSAVQRLLAYREQESRAEGFPKARAALGEMFAEIGFKAPALDERLGAWATFLGTKVDRTDVTRYLRHALDQAFGYAVYADNRVDDSEVDDLRARRNEIEALRRLLLHRDRLQAAARYTRLVLPDAPQWQELRDAFGRGRSALAQLDGMIDNEARLLSELLDPMQEAIDSYSVHYLQVYDEIAARAEELRLRLDAARTDPRYAVLAVLAQAPQLGADARPVVDRTVEAERARRLYPHPAGMLRADIERQLRQWPKPPEMELTLDNAAGWFARLQEGQAGLDDLLDRLLGEKAALLASPALRSRLSRHSQDGWIGRLLAAADAEGVRAALLDAVKNATAAERADMGATLQRSLRQMAVHRLRLADFDPPKRTLERTDVEAVAAHFRAFLEAAFAGDDETLTIVELE